MTRASDTFSTIIKNEFDAEEAALILGILNKYDDRNLEWHNGLGRITFLISGRLVVKIPYNLSGVGMNDWEASVSNPIFARTRSAWPDGIPIVFMEWVNDASYYEIELKLNKVPEWVYGIDCGQVGFNRKGDLVAYDYGS